MVDETGGDAERSTSGFTLVEVLLVMLITSILVLGMSSAFRQAHRLWSKVEDQRQPYYVAGSVIESLRADLAGLYLPPVEEGRESFMLSAQPDGSVDLTFYSLSPSWRTGAIRARSALIRYQYKPGQETDGSILERFETPCAGELTVGEPVSDILAQGEFNLRVWALAPEGDGSPQSLKTSYESHERPPDALKVVFEFSEHRGVSPISFVALMEVPCESVLQEVD